MTPRRPSRIATALALGLSASACTLLRGATPPLSAAEAAAAGCYLSPGGWWFFGDPQRADSAVKGWLVLHRHRNRRGSYLAEFTGSSSLSMREHPSTKEAGWGMRNDSLWIGWVDGFSSMGIRAVVVDGELRGTGSLSTDEVVDSAGVLIPARFTWQVWAPRVPCEQVPEIPSQR